MLHTLSKYREKGGWFELESYFDPEKIQSVNIPETTGTRTFLMGKIGEFAVVEVDANTDPGAAEALSVKLEEMGVPALIVTNHVRFLKLRRCSFGESRILDAKESESHCDGAGPEPDGDGDRSGPRIAAPVSGGGEDEIEDPDAGED